MILGLLAVLFVPLPLLTEGTKVKDSCLSQKYNQPKERLVKASNEVQVKVFPIAVQGN